jgi:hypothetical protein
MTPLSILEPIDMMEIPWIKEAVNLDMNLEQWCYIQHVAMEQFT